MRNNNFYSIAQVAEKAGISRDTLVRWLKAGKVPEPDRDRNGWRIFTDADLRTILRYANKVVPSPRKQQGNLQLKRNK